MSSEDVHLTNFKNHTGIYFENIGTVNYIENYWTIINVVDSKKYFKKLQIFKNLFIEADSLCNDKECNDNKLRLKAEIFKAYDNFELLLKQYYYLNAVKSNSDIFKTACESFFEDRFDYRYFRNISKLMGSTKFKENSFITKNSGTILESKENLLNIELIKYLENLIIDGQNKSVEIQKENFMMFSNKLISNLKVDFSKEFIIKSAFLSFEDNVLAELDRIEETLNPQYTILPEFVYFKKLVKKDFIVYHDKLLFHIQFPIFKTQETILYRVIPLPTKVLNYYLFIQPGHNFFAVNKEGSSYNPYSQNEIDSCQEFGRNLVCKIPFYSYNLVDPNHCEIDLLMDSEKGKDFNFCFVMASKDNEFFVNLYNQNRWLFSVREEKTLKSTCDGISRATQMSGEGILEIGENCRVSIDNVLIHGQNIPTIFQNPKSIKVPKINIDESFYFHNINVERYSDEKEDFYSNFHILFAILIICIILFVLFTSVFMDFGRQRKIEALKNFNRY